MQRERALLNDVRKACDSRDPSALIVALKAADVGGVPNDLILEYRVVLNALEVTNMCSPPTNLYYQTKAKAAKDLSSAITLRDASKMSSIIDYGKTLLSPAEGAFRGIDLRLNEVRAGAVVVWCLHLKDNGHRSDFISEAARRSQDKSCCRGSYQIRRSCKN